MEPVYKVAYAGIPVSREMMADSAFAGVALSVALGVPPQLAIVDHGRRTGYMIADAPAVPTFDIFDRAAPFLRRLARPVTDCINAHQCASGDRRVVDD